MADDQLAKSTRGRKRKLTDSTRKKRKKEVNERLNKSRVYVGDQFDRWTELKDALRLNTHAEVAKTLLDRYYDAERETVAPIGPIEEPQHEIEKLSTPTDHVTSTPGPSTRTLSRIGSKYPEISDISSAESHNVEEEMSGVEEMSKRRKTHHKQTDKSRSFLNPFELSMIGISETESCEERCSDEDYQPSFNLTLRPNNKEFELLELEDDLEGGLSDNEDDEIDLPEVDVGPGVTRIRHADEIDPLCLDQAFMVYYQCIVDLANTNVQKICKVKGCGQSVEISKQVIGSALYLKWVCMNNHLVHKWCSQPVLNRRMHSGDLLMAAAVLLSGNNFKKIELFSKFLKMPIISNTTFHKIQRSYLVPSVDDYWLQQQEQVAAEFRGKDLVVLGDGRNDSPGHTAQYCSYTFMEQTSKKILTIITMDKRMTELKSTNLEKSCFIKGMKQLKDIGLNIVEVVTDAHTQIAAVMKKDFPDIKHSFDIWHGTKNLGKKIISLGQEKNKKELSEWTKDIMNHYWYCAQISNSYEEFLGVWYGILHHVTDQHEWILPYSDSNANSCKHGPLLENRTKGWLKPDSPAHVALRNVVMDKRRLNQIHYYLNCRSTAELENFQNLILVYASKRHSYTPPTYRARNRLAALDNNGHFDREVKTNKDGTTRYQRSFNKKSGIWSAHPVKVEKTYAYVQDIITLIVKKRLSDEVGMASKVVLEADDPRRIAKTLAPIPPPATSELVEKRKSRFGMEDPEKTIDYVWT